MAASFSTVAKRLVRYLGYPIKDLPANQEAAVVKYVNNGAVKKVGEIESVEILHRNDGSSPLHKSAYNPEDKEDIISARITPVDGSKARTHHIYMNGTGTIKKGGVREYSSRA